MQTQAFQFDHQGFSQLSRLQQQLLTLIAIVYAPVATTPLASCASHLGINDPETGKAFTMHSMRSCLVDLIHAGWLDGNQGRYYVPAALRETLLLQALESGEFDPIAEQVLSAFPASESFGRIIWQSLEHGLSHARIYLYQGKVEKLAHILELLKERYNYKESPLINPGFFVATFGSPPRTGLLNVLNDEMLQYVFDLLLADSIKQLENARELWKVIKQRDNFNLHLPLEASRYLTRSLYCLYSKDWAQLPDVLNETDPNLQIWYFARASKKLQAANIEVAINEYQIGLEAARIQQHKSKHNLLVFQHEHEKLYLLALYASQQSKYLEIANKRLNRLDDSFDKSLFTAYAATFETGSFQFSADLDVLKQEPFSLLLYCTIKNWLGQALSPPVLDILKHTCKKTASGQYHWLTEEFTAALASHGNIDDNLQAPVANNDAALFNLVEPRADWQRALSAINQLVDTPEDEDIGQEQRLVWILENAENDQFRLQAKLQKKNSRNIWSKGRNISLKRLKKETHTLPELNEQDKSLIACIHEQPDYHSYTHRGSQFNLDMDSIWPLLVNHPHVYRDLARNTPIKITHGEFELIVNNNGDNLDISLYPAIPQQNQQKYLIIKETPTRLCIYEKSKQVMKLYDIIANGLTVPRHAESDLRNTLNTLAPMIRIHSEIADMHESTKLKTDSRIHINLLPYGEGLSITLRVKPMGEIGHYLIPAEGRESIYLEHEQQQYSCKRDLNQEKQNLVNLFKHSPLLLEYDELDDEIILQHPEDCLSLLEQLYELNDDIIMAWPEGEVMRIQTHLDTGNMRLNIRENGEWFQLDGNIATDTSLVLSLRQLLELAAGNRGRFLALGEGQYLSLTSQFRKKLETLRSLSELNEEGAKISHLAALALDDFTDSVGQLTVDEAWQAQIDKLESLESVQFELPETLNAELRDYQITGYKWLSRLAYWGVGACLADDMGLGKTLQALAIILQRAVTGPTLVVAPTSVSNNWHSEIEKFTPSLRGIFYRGKNRASLIKNADKNDIIICSYGLLQQDADIFIEKHWATIVLDEAQAIKNVNAKRSKTAHQLNGDFKIVTTGTPIENHLGELWSLFRFLNPGLLGTQKHFMQNFITPIERDRDDDRRETLKRLIQPFILRRTKTQVLGELPEKTEISLSIELSDGERAMYEAVRSRALETIAQKGKSHGGDYHLKVLKAITQLRLASCHPQLVLPSSSLDSSKLSRLEALIEELLENDHKALIFSQFVKHLSIIRNMLDEKGIHYQYLDGSTPIGQRKKNVDAFQAGEGDLFLISLKAGGAGLNLTAADYVIHMDPWWNPAVEDQASDRAHRIGQTRPVTIYRLVTENTIEEKIVKLHQQKRDLADSLLDGSDISGSMGTEEMLALIRENQF